MLTILTGAVGAGKSMYAVKTLLEWLQDGQIVYTNLQLNVDRIQEYMRKRDVQVRNEEGEMVPIEVHKQIRFFVHAVRPPGMEDYEPESEYDLPLEFEGTDINADAARLRCGNAKVLIDEANHDFPDGRLSRSAERMLSRMRHYGVSITMICPDPQSLAAKAKRACSYVWYIEDLAKTGPKFLGFLPAPPVRMCYEYLGIKGSRFGPQQRAWPVHPDPDIRWLYDSTGGTYGMETPDDSDKELIEAEKNNSKLKSVWVMTFLGAGAIFAFSLVSGWYTINQLRHQNYQNELRNERMKVVEDKGAKPMLSEVVVEQPQLLPEATRLSKDALCVGYDQQRRIMLDRGFWYLETEAGSNYYWPSEDLQWLVVDK